jgi:hypothetical protein
VYIADPSHTVSGGGPSCLTPVRGRCSIRGLPPLSVGVIECFLLPVLVSAVAQSPAADRHTVGNDDQVLVKRSNTSSHLRIVTQSCQI